MGRAQWAFIGGLANGGLAEYHRQKQQQRADRAEERQMAMQAAQLERQERQDAMAKAQFDITMSNAQRAQRKQDEEDAIEQTRIEMNAAGEPQAVNVVSGGIANDAVVKNPENASIVADRVHALSDLVSLPSGQKVYIEAKAFDYPEVMTREAVETRIMKDAEALSRGGEA